MFRDRFAPSPNGLLHLGHAYSALSVWKTVQNNRGEFILRIEDIDTARSRPEFESAIFDDLTWLGITWQQPVLRQSDRLSCYTQAISTLVSMGVCYPCRCTRADIRNALAAPQENGRGGNTADAGAPPYPGSCRGRRMEDATNRDSIRLDIAKAVNLLGGRDAISELWFDEVGAKHAGRHYLSADTLIGSHGDIVIARRDVRTSYHLAVVVDDGEQKITQVTRGEDLFGATSVHRLLQQLLGLPVPVWNHHRLIRDGTGMRLAKRQGSASIQSLRNSGKTREDIRKLVGLPD